MSTSTQSGIWHGLKLIALLYLFFLSIDLVQGSFKLFGQDFAEGLIQATTNPLVGLCIGILATGVVQSSSVTTSLLVGLVAAGGMSIRNAIPIVMGANIGTTVTCAIVAIAYVTRGREFQRAYAAASVHDLFKLLSVLVLLPLETTTHFIERTCVGLTELFEGVGGVQLGHGPLKAIVKPVAGLLKQAVGLFCPQGTVVEGIVLLLVGFLFLAVALKYLSGTMKEVISGRVEKLVNDYLFSRPLRALTLGALLTALVQSSSVTTSLLVPLVAGGIFSLEKVYPFMLGANIGTTITAILASLATGHPAALTVALAHLMFNCCGILIWYPLRRVPFALAESLARLAVRYKALAIAYVIALFYAIPLIIIFVLR